MNLGFRRRYWISILVILVSLWGGWIVAAQENLSQPQIEQAAYAQSCGTCHIALPAEVLPSESWRVLLQDPNHYGQQIATPTGATLQLAWGYLKGNSRRLIEKEQVPYRLAESRFFKALHPGVEFPLPVRATTCIDCHVAAQSGDFVVP
jgi:hypothetical protein